MRFVLDVGSENKKKYLCGKFTQKYLDVKVIRYIFAYEIHNNLNR